MASDISDVSIKDICYGLGKNSQNQQLLDILACNSAKRPSLLTELKALSTAMAQPVETATD